MSAQFFFHWANAGETSFGAGQQSYDEPVLDFAIDHAEGQIPTLAVTLQNPGVGLLAPGRKLYAWLSYSDGVTVTPLFFGRLIAIADGPVEEKISAKFTARPLDYLRQKQLVAEGLKVAPFYDPVFLSLDKEDDPDAILEGYSAFYHVDRVTQTVSVSDWLVGEDGTITLSPADVDRKSVATQIGQPPLVAVAVQAEVHWTQAWIGTVDFGANTILSYSGDGIIGDWPKPESSLGGGWSVAASVAADALGVSWALTANLRFSYKNKSKKHQNGDTMSVEESSTVALAAGITGVLTQVYQEGIVDPYNRDIDGDPDPINQPQTLKINSSLVPLWQVNTSLTLRYEAARQRKERLLFTLSADLQPEMVDPLVSEDTELITLSGRDVGLPLLDLRNWDSVANSAVALGDLVFPGDPSLPGQTSTQVCTTAGVTGATEPTFSNIAGVTTADGAAVWTSLGATQVSESAPDWILYQNVPLGQLILPRVPIYLSWKTLATPGLITVPPTGPTFNLYQIVQGSNGYFFQCVLAGIGGFVEPAWATAIGALTNDGSAQWLSLGAALPDGVTYYICTRAGVTGQTLPPFAATLGAVTNDGAAQWTCIGAAAVPVGGAPGFTPASSYFPSPRGLTSVQNALCRARAKLRWRARAVKVSAKVSFAQAINFSCRKNLVIPHPLLPGGQAAGKIVSYRIAMRAGDLRADVTIGCTIGNAGAVSAVTGTPTVDDGTVFAPGVELYAGAYALLDAVADLSYTPPSAAPVDDGLVFPLSKRQVVIGEAVMGSLAAQESAIATALAFASSSAYAQQQQAGTLMSSIVADEAAMLAAQYSVANQLKLTPIWYQLSLKPVDGGPYAASYALATTPLSLPKTIDLAA